MKLLFRVATEGKKAEGSRGAQQSYTTNFPSSKWQNFIEARGGCVHCQRQAAKQRREVTGCQQEAAVSEAEE